MEQSKIIDTLETYQSAGCGTMVPSASLSSPSPRPPSGYRCCTIWCTGSRRPAKTCLQCETSERQRKQEIIHLLKRADVTDTVRALSSAKDEAPPEHVWCGSRCGSRCRCWCNASRAAPEEVGKGKVRCIFFLDFACSNWKRLEQRH